MIPRPEGIRKYRTAHYRYLQPAIEDFFKRELPGIFGPMVITNIAKRMVEIFDEKCPPLSSVKHGQLVWNALDKTTRPDSPHRKYKTVILDLVTDEDVKCFERQESPAKVKSKVIARLIEQTYQQGGVLSSRDLSLIMSTAATRISFLRAAFEKEHQVVLHHNGVVNDVGPTVTHKAIIIYKFVVEKKSPNIIAQETKHSQKAVDRYLNDFARVKLLLKDKKSINYIHIVTHLSISVIKQYVLIINQYFKERI